MALQGLNLRPTDYESDRGHGVAWPGVVSDWEILRTDGLRRSGLVSHLEFRTVHLVDPPGLEPGTNRL